MLQDIRHACRTFLRMPGFTATATLTLALGIGANTAIFSVVYALLLKPLPFRDPGQLIYVHDTSPTLPSSSMSWSKFVALRDGNRSLSALAATTFSSLTLSGRGEPLQVQAYRVSGDFFKVLDAAPLRGRWIAPADDVPNADGVVVISYGLWQRIFGGDPAIVGTSIVADGKARTVIGVMPAGFGYPPRTEAWVPLAVRDSDPRNNFLRLVGRLKPDVPRDQAADDLRTLTAVFNRQHALTRDVLVWSLHDFLTANQRQMLIVLQGAVLLVLLVACANVANMLLARSVARRRELAIRAAIGASPSRILRQLLTESVILSAAGAGLGVLLAGWLLRLFLAIAPPGFSGLQTIAIDRHVLVFTVVVAMVTGIVFGLAPARRGFRVDANDGLRDASGRGTTSFRARGASRFLVIAEVALAIVLVVGAGLMVKSLLALRGQHAGFTAEGLLTFQLALPEARYDDGAVRRTMKQIADELRSVPGVTAAGAVNYLPLVQFGFSGPFSIAGHAPLASGDRAPAVEYRVVLPGYFQAMRIPILRGADFTERQGETDRPVVIINDAMARRYWADANPIGARVHLAMDEDSVVREVVGVAGDVRSATLDRVPVPEVFVPHAQVPVGSMGFTVRTAGDPAALLPAVRQRVAAIDPDVPLARPQTMTALVDASTGAARLSSVLTSMFAIVAAMLATVGIYGLVAYSVAQRTREIGIRVALGANPAAVLRLIVGEGLVLALGGLALGLAGTWALTGTLRTMLFEVSPADPVVLGATCLAVIGVTCGASFVPARRVMRVDPTIALRAE